MKNCWMSPKGDVYYVDSHITGAYDIIEELGLDDERASFYENTGIDDLEVFLEFKGFCKYSENKLYQGWHKSPEKRYTKAQKSMIYNLTGDVIE